MRPGTKDQSIYRQTSKATNAGELEAVYNQLGYDFKINEIAYDETINYTFRATPLDAIRVIRSTYTPSFYVMDKEDTDQGFQIFHEGTGVSVVNGTEIPLSPDHATFHSGHQRMERHDASPGDTTYVMWDESDLLRFVSDHLGREVTTPVAFATRLDFDRPVDLQLRRMLDYLEHHVIPVADDLNMPLVKANMANLFFSMILSAQDNNYSDLLLTPQSPALPAHVKRARDYMCENAQLPVTMADLVTISGVSGSSLHAGFRRYLDISPMAYLKRLRLDHVRRELNDGEPGPGINATARKWGFTHLGRFSRDYAERFGELPSQTALQ